MARNKKPKNRVNPPKANTQAQTTRTGKRPPPPPPPPLPEGKHGDYGRLPAWYHRVLSFSYNGRRDVSPSDFDEDISDLEEKHAKKDVKDSSSLSEKKQEKELEEEECTKCDGDDSDCECWDKRFPSDEKEEEEEDSDSWSVGTWSYCGSDADYYYEMKVMREERKRDLHDAKLEEAASKITDEKEYVEALAKERVREKEILEEIAAVKNKLGDNLQP